MASVIANLDQVCDPCAALIANGEAWENHENVSERTSQRQVERWGKLAPYLVLSCGSEEWCTREVIGVCDACGAEPATGYWFGHEASVIYGGTVTVGAEARALAAKWQSSGTVGSVLAELASTGSADVDALMRDMERTVIHAGLYTVATNDMDALLHLVITALKEDG